MKEQMVNPTVDGRDVTFNQLSGAFFRRKDGKGLIFHVEDAPEGRLVRRVLEEGHGLSRFGMVQIGPNEVVTRLSHRDLGIAGAFTDYSEEK